MKYRKTKLALTVLVILLVVAGGVIYFRYFRSDYEKVFSVAADSNQLMINPGGSTTIDHDEKYGLALNGNQVYILFLGIDKNDEREETMSIFRTDTIALARFDLANKDVKVLCIPRDTYTFVPIENKMDKINHAYAYGSMSGSGPEESIKAVNQLLGQTVVNYYFLIDMEEIPEIVDEIGGVKVDVDMDMNSGEVVVHKGLQVLNGKQARAYIRYRKSPGGDIDRIRHQQKFIVSLLKQQKTVGKLLETAQIGLQYHGNIQTDLSFEQVIGLARFMSDIPGDQIEYSIIPGKAKMINGVSYWVMKDAEAPGVIEEFLR